MITATLTDFDIHLWSEGRHHRAYEKLGAHVGEQDGVVGTNFAVWAPNARHVAVVGDFNDWRRDPHPMRPTASSGIWECFIPNIAGGALYKYFITSRHRNFQVDKADPYGFAAEIRPQ